MKAFRLGLHCLLIGRCMPLTPMTMALLSQDLAHVNQAMVCRLLLLIAAHNLSMFVYRDIPINPCMLGVANLHSPN